MAGDAVKAALDALAGTHEDRTEPPGLIERYTAWADGRHDEGMAYSLAFARSQCADRIAAKLFEASVLCDLMPNRDQTMREVAEWGYTQAAQYASRGRQRYRLDWGRRAALDGLALAMWDDARPLVPSTVARAAQFDVGEKKFRYTRKHVHDYAADLITEFRGWLSKSANSPD